MKIKKLFSMLVIAMVAILMLTAVLSTVQAVDAASKVKVTWDANGGKIGTAKIATTTVTKGAKIGKLKTPKKTGYAFKGWYTKKSGGTKITATTKVKNKVTLYAHWKKGNSNPSRVLNAEEKKLVGKWESSWDGSTVHKYNADGSFFKVAQLKGYDWGFMGYYYVKNGMLTLRYQHAKDYTGAGFSSKTLVWSNWETGSPSSLKFYTEDGKQYMTLDDGIPYRKIS